MGLAKDTRTKQMDTSIFWHVVVPILVLIILLFVLFVVFTMPDWALICSSDLTALVRHVKKTAPVE
jgi:hypothetical protein